MSYEETWSYTRRTPHSGGLFGSQPQPPPFGSLQSQPSRGGFFGSQPQPPPFGSLQSQPSRGGLFGSQPQFQGPFGSNNIPSNPQPQSGGLFGSAQPTRRMLTSGTMGGLGSMGGLPRPAITTSAASAQVENIADAMRTLHELLPRLEAEIRPAFEHIFDRILGLSTGRLQTFPFLSEAEEQRLRAALHLMLMVIAFMGRLNIPVGE